MPITRTPIIDDSGSGQDGTVIDNAWKQQFYDQIDALTAPAWQTALPALFTDDAGTELVKTLSLSRIQRLTPTTLIWQLNMNAITLPIASANIYLSYTPWRVSGLYQMNPIAMHSFGVGAYVDTFSEDRFRVRRVDLGNITAGTHFFVFTSVWEVEP